jgi:hypothetical protein
MDLCQFGSVEYCKYVQPTYALFAGLVQTVRRPNKDRDGDYCMSATSVS